MTLTNWLPIIALAVQLIFPLAVALATWLAHRWLAALPDRQRTSIEAIAHTVVTAVEQSMRTYDPLAKKAAAMTLAADLLKQFNIPQPPPQVLDTVVESAVYALNRAQDALTTKTTSS